MKGSSPNNLQSSTPKYRRAELPDLEHIVGLILDLDGKVGHAYQIPTNPKSAAHTALFLIKHGLCLVGPHSFAGGQITHFPFNYNATVGTIIAWNFTKPSEARILEALIEEFRLHGATHVTASSHPPDHRTSSLYERLGFKEAETQHLLKLSCQIGKTGVSD